MIWICIGIMIVYNIANMVYKIYNRTEEPKPKNISKPKIIPFVIKEYKTAEGMKTTRQRITAVEVDGLAWEIEAIEVEQKEPYNGNLVAINQQHNSNITAT